MAQAPKTFHNSFLATVVLVFLSLLLVFFSYTFFTRYGSAFEADQACHSSLNNLTSDEYNFGCDHDLETRQWILFKRIGKEGIASVIERYRY